MKHEGYFNFKYLHSVTMEMRIYTSAMYKNDLFPDILFYILFRKSNSKSIIIR